MTLKELSKLNDRELITLIKNHSTTEREFQESYKVLLERYLNQIHKNWWRLKSSIHADSITNTFKDEYYCEAYEAFVTAVNRISLEKIRDDNWKLVGYLDFYLRNVRKNLTQEIFKLERERPLECDNDDSTRVSNLNEAETSYWETSGYLTNPEYAYLREEEVAIKKGIIEECAKKWNPQKYRVYKGMFEGKSSVETAKELSLTPTQIYGLKLRLKADVRKAYKKFLASTN